MTQTQVIYTGMVSTYISNLPETTYSLYGSGEKHNAPYIAWGHGINSAKPCWLWQACLPPRPLAPPTHTVLSPVISQPWAVHWPPTLYNGRLKRPRTPFLKTKLHVTWSAEGAWGLCTASSPHSRPPFLSQEGSQLLLEVTGEGHVTVIEAATSVSCVGCHPVAVSENNTSVNYVGGHHVANPEATSSVRCVGGHHEAVPEATI